ncbi:DUF4238 domain-containing protein [Agrobacterium rosae]|uniref:DUF4238 domain-containing protein n=1 Tax=Agrobacterium rosae TaxID=1972867 RepID=UPI003A80DDAE
MKHHYIPQFYLRPWLGPDHKLEEFGREPRSGQIRSRRRGTNSTGYEDDLYTIPGATEDTKHNIERIFMGAVDKTAAAARDQLMNNVIPDGNERAAWARFLMSLAMRTPAEIRDFQNKFVDDYMAEDDFYELKYQAIRKDGWPETLVDYLKQEGREAAERRAITIATDLMQHENVTRLFMSARWWVLDTSKVRRHLMTSDHPVVMTNGLGKDDGHFALAIGPRRLFIAFMKERFSENFRRMPVGKIVRLFNDAVVGQGRKNVYGTDNSNIAEVRRMMGKREYISLIPKPQRIMNQVAPRNRG